MVRSRAVARRHWAQREETELWLESKGVQWTFVPDVPIEDFDKDRSLRNQARITQVLNDERVETYKEAMERGDRFPAVVAYLVDGRYVLIDGNHRLEAAEQANKPLSVYAIASDTDPTTIIAMTYEANAKHGLPNSVEDRQLHAVFLLRSGATSQENAAAALNLSKAQVSKAWAKAKADERAHEAGLIERQWIGLPVAARLRLGAIRTDEGFNAMADLAIKANLTTDEIDRHVVDINRSRSAVGQKAIVEELKPVYRRRIQATAGGLATKRGRGSGSSPRTFYQMGVGQIIRLQDNVETIVEGFADAEIEESINNSELLVLIATEIVEGLKKRQKGA